MKNSINFKEMRNTELYLLSLDIGLKHGKRIKLANRSNLFRINEMRDNEWITLSIGFAELTDISVFETKVVARRVFKV